jgi:glutamyl-tRNA synthetase
MQDLIDGFDVGTFGTAPTRFDAEDLFPLTRADLRTRPYAAVAAGIAALGVPADLAERFWLATRESITVMADLGPWWDILRDGAVAAVDPEDEGFVTQALAMLPARPWGPATWADWTAAVGAATGRKGRGLFRPLRRALTGRDTGPEMADLLPLMQAPPRRA